MIELIFMMLLVFNAIMLVISSVLCGIGFIGFVLIIANTKTSRLREIKKEKDDENE